MKLEGVKMTIVFQKSMLKSKHAKRIVRDGMLTYFKEKVFEHLDALEAKEKKREQAVQKALLWEETLRKAAYPVGTVREWKGKKYIKVAPGKWRRKYDKEGKGTRQSIASIKRKVDACITVEELLQVVKQNKHRFTDENGRYLPVVREMFDYVSEAHKKIKNMRSAKHSVGGSTGGFVFSLLGDGQKARLAKEINSAIVAEIKPDTVPYNGGEKFENAARRWIEGNSQGNAKTVIGEVEIDAGAVRADARHNLSEGYIKLQILPAIKDILERGTYLGYEKDYNNEPKDNHYFAGKIMYGGKERIVFCRVRKSAGANNRFYVHEVFTAEEVKAAPSKKAFRSLRNKPLYQFILHDVFTAADRIKEARKQNKKGISKHVSDPRLAWLTGNPLDSTLPKTSGDVKQESAGKKGIKKSARGAARLKRNKAA